MKMNLKLMANIALLTDKVRSIFEKPQLTLEEEHTVPTVSQLLARADLCFVIDTTGSMGPFIEAAKRQLLKTIEALGAERSVDLQIGLVEYRDHPPQDKSFVTTINPLTPDLARMQKVINRLNADGGGDAPEAVYDGVFEACTKMEWREFSCRFILLVGDAPPHGVDLEVLETTRRRHGHDAWPSGCPCGLNMNEVTAAAEDGRIVLHALAMRSDNVTIESFSAIARATGGSFALTTSADRVVTRIKQVIDSDFQNLDFDRRMLEKISAFDRIDVSAIADAEGCTRLAAASSIARLGKRGFLNQFVNQPG